MSRTDLDATTLANSLRMKAGDGSIEWVSEPMRASVLLDIADMLEESDKLRELVKAMTPFLCCMPFASCNTLAASVRKRMSELGIEVDE